MCKCSLHSWEQGLRYLSWFPMWDFLEWFIFLYYNIILLGTILKKGETMQARRYKLAKQYWVSVLASLMMDCKWISQIKPFHTSCFVMVFYHSNRNRLKTIIKLKFYFPSHEKKMVSMWRVVWKTRHNLSCKILRTTLGS